jgi:hypothetical protein
MELLFGFDDPEPESLRVPFGRPRVRKLLKMRMKVPFGRPRVRSG